MDINQMLNLERRTGIKDSEIDDFERKVNDVNQAIKGMLDGSIAPENVKIEGIDSEEEKLRKQQVREVRLKTLKEKEEKLKLQRKNEEKERWWAGVEVCHPNNNLAKRISSTSDASMISSSSSSNVVDNLVVLNRYTADYSRWNEWIPNDEATLAEIEETKANEELIRNKEFESNNSEFCNQFLSDMEERKKKTTKKQENAEAIRLKGNRYFKSKLYEKALEQYMDALKESPFDPKTLNNIAQVYIKTKDYDDAGEFLSRTLYLEPLNVKALSRHALVLGEQGKYSEALIVVQQALDLDTTNNIDLIAQERELSIIQQEHTEELKLNNYNSYHLPHSDMLCDKIETQLVNKFNIYLLAILNNKDNVNINADELNYFKTLIKKENDNDRTSTFRTLFRTSHALDNLTSVLKLFVAVDNTIISNVDNVTNNTYAISMESIATMIDILSMVVDRQRASKLIISEKKVISLLKSMLKKASIENIVLIESILRLFHVLCADDTSIKTRTAIISDVAILCNLGNIIGNISYNLNMKNKVINPKCWEIIQLCSKIMKLGLFVSQNQTIFATFPQTDSAALIYAMATALQTTANHCLYCCNDNNRLSIQQQTQQQSEIALVSTIESLIEASLGLSQLQVFREYFSHKVLYMDKDNNIFQNKSPYTSLCASTLLAITISPAMFESNGIAILMNACLEASNEVRTDVIANGGLQLAISDLNLNDKERSLKDGITLVRKSGLLARLAGDTYVKKQLLHPNTFRLLCRRLVLPSSAHSSSSLSVSSSSLSVIESKEMVWMLDERANFTRVLANLTEITTEECLKIGVEENIIPSILAILPTPKEDGGEITARSVTLMPSDLASAIVLGNAARCLMPYADKPIYANDLYCNKSLYGIEKLICTMASCSDMRVRKNIAILLAKGCKLPGVRDKITELRGMQMMIELQDKL